MNDELEKIFRECSDVEVGNFKACKTFDQHKAIPLITQLIDKDTHKAKIKLLKQLLKHSKLHNNVEILATLDNLLPPVSKTMYIYDPTPKEQLK